MTVQTEINEALERLHADYLRLNNRLQTDASKRIDRTRLDIYDLLTDYKRNNETISQSRINSLLRELDYVERSIYDEAYKALEQTAQESASTTTVAISAILVSALAIDAFSSNKVGRIRNAVTDDVFNRVGTDNFSLDGRLRRLAGTYNDEVRNVLRDGILRGKSVNSLVADVKRVYDGEDWKIRRLVRTEGNAAHRLGAGRSAEESEVVQGLRLIPGEKLSPGCVNLAAEDRYGLGVGIFLPSDPDIYSPHPNCTSYLVYVLKDEYLRGGRY